MGRRRDWYARGVAVGDYRHGLTSAHLHSITKLWDCQEVCCTFLPRLDLKGVTFVPVKILKG